MDANTRQRPARYLAAELTSDGFKNVKGPHGSPTPQKWHVTLGEDRQDAKAQVTVLRGKDWHLWLVPQPGDDCRLHGYHCPTWTLISLAPTPTPTPTPTPVRAPCLGACNDEGRVTIDDLITMVNIANGTTPISACPAADAEHTGTVTVDQILAAVSNALNGCPPTAG